MYHLYGDKIDKVTALVAVLCRLPSTSCWRFWTGRTDTAERPRQRPRRRKRRKSPSCFGPSSASVTTCMREFLSAVSYCRLVLLEIRFLHCICFPFSYVPALRPLRQQAFLLSFPQTQPSRLTQRLAEVSACILTHILSKNVFFNLSFCLQISLQQGLKADTGALMSLCEKTDNDIRSCINTLQVCTDTEGRLICLRL